MYISIKNAALATIGMISLFLVCDFPYKPEPFTLPVQPYLFPSSSEIQTFFGTANVKFTYVLKDNGHNTVFYFDNNDTSRIHQKLKKAAGNENFEADSPLLSPDGSFVAYDLRQATSIYGAYIQKLDPNSAPVLIDANGTEPHWWVDTTVSPHQVYVIYSDQIILPLGSTIPQGNGHTYKRKVSLAGNGSTLDASVAIAPYPMNGGMSIDGNYLCAGYEVAAFYNLTTQSSPTIINVGHQVCNPSICPSIAHPDWMMFLNFVGKQSLNGDFPADSTLAMHSYIFIVDINNNVKDYVPVTIMGSGFHSWECPEWSNNLSFAAAIALPEESSATGEGVIIKGFGDIATAKETLTFTKGNGKLNYSSTPSVWIGND